MQTVSIQKWPRVSAPGVWNLVSEDCLKVNRVLRVGPSTVTGPGPVGASALRVGGMGLGTGLFQGTEGSWFEVSSRDPAEGLGQWVTGCLGQEWRSRLHMNS